MSKHNVVCCFCDEPIEPCEAAICKSCIDELHKNIHKLQARIAELEAENAKLRASAVVWHKYPEEKPIDGRYLFWDSDGNAPHVLPYNDIVVRDNPGVFSTQTHWAYLPAPPQEEE